MAKDTLLTGWEVFHKGKWTKDPPKSPGCYPIADRDGIFRGVCVVEFSHSAKKLFGMVAGSSSADVNTVWKGWWWSVPLPAFPVPKDWEK